MLFEYIKKVAAQRGWNDYFVMELLCRFIELSNDDPYENRVMELFKEFLKGVIEEEEEVSKELCE